jgi:hypothetical protein
MNGAELPNGNVLHVEPASSNSSSGACSQQQSPYGPPANAASVATESQASHEQPHEQRSSSGEVKAKDDETPAQAADNDNDNDEDLDDFFDSL